MWNESLGSRPHRAASTPKAIELRVVLESYVKVRLLSQCGNLGYFSSVPEAVVSRLLIVDPQLFWCSREITGYKFSDSYRDGEKRMAKRYPFIHAVLDLQLDHPKELGGTATNSVRRHLR
jgi:hypothetical protein